MIKKVFQFRYFNENNGKNYPDGLSSQSLYQGLPKEYFPVTQLSIQTLPGVKFYLNASINPIEVGFSGVYNIDLTNFSEITELRFDNQSLNQINNNLGGYLYIDLIKEESENQINPDDIIIEDGENLLY